MKKAVFSLLAIALVLAVAVPVFAGGDWFPPSNWDTETYPLPDANNIGCSARAWGVTDAKGFALEYETAYLNLGAAFPDDTGLSAVEIETVATAAYLGEHKNGKLIYDKDFVEYLKLWNKGWGEWVNGVWVVHKTCP